MQSSRKIIDCRLQPSGSKCTLAISGTEEEVIKAAIQHAVVAHQQKDTPELRKHLHSLMQDETLAQK